MFFCEGEFVEEGKGKGEGGGEEVIIYEMIPKQRHVIWCTVVPSVE